MLKNRLGVSAYSALGNSSKDATKVLVFATLVPMGVSYLQVVLKDLRKR